MHNNLFFQPYPNDYYLYRTIGGASLIIQWLPKNFQHILGLLYVRFLPNFVTKGKRVPCLTLPKSWDIALVKYFMS